MYRQQQPWALFPSGACNGRARRSGAASQLPRLPQPTSLRCCMCCRWTDLENNPALQEYANYGLGAAYGLIALVALVSCHAVLLPATAAAATLQQQHLQRCLAATLFEALLQHATWSAYQQQRLITAT